MTEYTNITCKKVYNDYNTCENCIKNKLNNCSTCPLSQGKCTACKFKNG